MNANVEKTNANGNGCADVKESGDGNENKPAAISTDVSLPNDVLERLFQRYSIKQRRAGLECFLATSVLFDLWVILVPQQGRSYENIGMYRRRRHVMFRVFFFLSCFSFPPLFFRLHFSIRYRALLGASVCVSLGIVKSTKAKNLIKVLCSPLEFIVSKMCTRTMCRQGKRII